jgi:Flp pilus assembly protein TadD
MESDNLRQRDRVDGSAAELETAEPDEAKSQVQLGWTRYSEEDLAGALTAFERSRDLAPDSIDACYGLGIVLKAMGRREDAARAFDKVAELARITDAKSSRMQMLRRMALAQASHARTGQWSVEDK